MLSNMSHQKKILHSWYVKTLNEEKLSDPSKNTDQTEYDNNPKDAKILKRGT